MAEDDTKDEPAPAPSQPFSAEPTLTESSRTWLTATPGDEVADIDSDVRRNALVVAFRNEDGNRYLLITHAVGGQGTVLGYVRFVDRFTFSHRG